METLIEVVAVIYDLEKGTVNRIPQGQILQLAGLLPETYRYCADEILVQ